MQNLVGVSCLIGNLKCVYGPWVAWLSSCGRTWELEQTSFNPLSLSLGIKFFVVERERVCIYLSSNTYSTHLSKKNSGSCWIPTLHKHIYIYIYQSKWQCIEKVIRVSYKDHSWVVFQLWLYFQLYYSLLK